MSSGLLIFSILTLRMLLTSNSRRKCLKQACDSDTYEIDNESRLGNKRISSIIILGNTILPLIFKQVNCILSNMGFSILIKHEICLIIAMINSKLSRWTKRNRRFFTLFLIHITTNISIETFVNICRFIRTLIFTPLLHPSDGNLD